VEAIGCSHISFHFIWLEQLSRHWFGHILCGLQWRLNGFSQNLIKIAGAIRH